MINQSDILEHQRLGFDGDKYIFLQKGQIEDRISQFSGKLYLEVGGKLVKDSHASRVLPGFYPDSKVRILSEFVRHADILFCINAQDLEHNRPLTNEDISYQEYVFGQLLSFEESLGIKPKIVIAMIKKGEKYLKMEHFVDQLKVLGYEVYRRYYIDDAYYNDPEYILSDRGYGQDDWINSSKRLVLVTGAASGSGKMATCMAQMYSDAQHGIQSGYAKYETFPIWNLELEHPVNLAYEAATADIGDMNCIDEYHLKAYGTKVVNYNRDESSFLILMALIKNIATHKNYMRKYKSPTDMGISTAGFAITDYEVVSQASLAEIRRRKGWYQQMLERGDGELIWVERCDKLEKKCLEYMEKKHYIV